MVRLTTVAACGLAWSGCAQTGSDAGTLTDTDTATATTTALPPIDTAIVSVGSYAGECVGACLYTVSFDAGVALTIDGWKDKRLPVVQQGTLTKGGLAELVRVEDGLATASLAEVYGCPDCLDGGGMHLEYEREGVIATSDWESGSPPEALVDVDALFAHLRAALKDCTTTEWVEPVPSCVPFE